MNFGHDRLDLDGIDPDAEGDSDPEAQSRPGGGSIGCLARRPGYAEHMQRVNALLPWPRA
jgi:hypothetical protein